MKKIEALPQIVKEAWENRKGPIIFTTISADAIPNSIYATCVSFYGNDSIIVANNFFNKTINNIKSGSKGSILMLTNDDKSFQFKGHIEYSESGAAFDNMKKWNPAKLPGKGAAVLVIEEIYSGAEKIA